LKVARQCPVVLLVEVNFRHGKVPRYGFYYEQRIEFEQGLYSV
jgi:hypothetical protein